MLCPLCDNHHPSKFHEDSARAYFRCPDCALIFVPNEYHLRPHEEKHRYDLHENSPDDPDYRKFLSQLIDPLLPHVLKGSKGLDYGSGPGPTLSVMLSELGFDMAIYDPIYANDHAALERKYDFITCTEAVEHFCRPSDEFKRMLSLLEPGGVIGIMTDMYEVDDDFPKWHYIRDDTHVGFYSKYTFEWIANAYRLSVSFPARSIAILEAPADFCIA